MASRLASAVATCCSLGAHFFFSPRLTTRCSQGALHSKGKEIDRKVSHTLKDKGKASERLELLAKRIDKLKAERAELETSLRASKEVVEQRRAAESKAKSGLIKKKKTQTDEEFVNACLADIEARVKEINSELERGNLGSVTEERRLLKEVQRIRATKSQIPQYLQRSKALQEARAAEKRAERDLESKESFIATLLAEMDDIKHEIATLDGKEVAETKPVKEQLTSEEQQLTDELNKLYAQLREAKDGLNTNREKWYEARREKARKAVEKQQQKRDEFRAQRAKEARERAASARAERVSVVPYAKEMGDCESLLQYLDGLLEADKPKSATEEVAAAPVAVAPPAGIVVKPAAPAVEDDWGSFAANNRKAKGGKGKAKKVNNQQPKFVMNLASMDQFTKQGFVPPMKMEDVPKTRELVKAKLDALQAKSTAERQVILDQIAKEEAEEARLQEKEKAAEAAAPSKEGDAAPAASKKE